MVLWRPTRLLRTNTQKRCPFHYRGLEWKSRKSETPGVTGKFGLGVQNEAGQRLIEFCQENALVIANILFQQHKFSSVQFSHSVLSHSLWPHESQHTRPPCPSSTPGVHPDSRPSSRWCHLVISSSVVPFSSWPQSHQATQEKTLNMEITRWSTPKSDWLYSLQPKMEKLYTVSKKKTRSWWWLISWTPYCQIQTEIEESGGNH